MKYKIKQVIPNDEGYRMANHADYERSKVDFNKIVCWALVEYDHGLTEVRPMIRVPNQAKLCPIFETPNTKVWIEDPE